MHDSHAVCASLLIFAAHKDAVCEDLRSRSKRVEELQGLTKDFGNCSQIGQLNKSSKVPVSRLSDDVIAEDFQLRRVLQFVRIAEIGIERGNIGAYRKLNKAGIATDDIVRKHGDADAEQAGALDRCLAVDLQMRYARIVGIACSLRLHFT